MRTEARVPEMVFIQGLITVGKRLLNATVKQEEIPIGTDKLQGIYLSCANFSVLYHLPASQTALQMLWITDVHNWCPCIGLWTPSSYWQVHRGPQWSPQVWCRYPKPLLWQRVWGLLRSCDCSPVGWGWSLECLQAHKRKALCSQP